MNQPVRPRKLGTPRTRYPPGRTSRAWFSTIRMSIREMLDETERVHDVEDRHFADVA